MKLLTRETANSKLKKNKTPTWNLSLSPAKSSGYEVCPYRTTGCTKSCVAYAGFAGVYPRIIKSRIKKTKMFFRHRKIFLTQLVKELNNIDKYCKKKNIIGKVRLNTFSDISWESIIDLSVYKNLYFYDYTKNIKRAMSSLSWTNYKLVYSYNEHSSWVDVTNFLNMGGNVAVVFGDIDYFPGISKIGKMPKSWKGYPVIDGDSTDDRTLDPPKSIIGLRLKGNNKRRESARHYKFAQLSIKKT